MDVLESPAGAGVEALVVVALREFIQPGARFDFVETEVEGEGAEDAAGGEHAEREASTEGTEVLHVVGGFERVQGFERVLRLLSCSSAIHAPAWSASWSIRCRTSWELGRRRNRARRPVSAAVGESGRGRPSSSRTEGSAVRGTTV